MKNDCAFCEYDGPSEILDTSQSGFVIEPIDPIVIGHRLVVPWDHVSDALVNPALTGEVFQLAAWHAKVMHGNNFNLITSIGSVATQTVMHLHVHIVPREFGDGLPLPWTKI